MRYTPLATDALCPMPYALCPMPARAPHVTEKGYKFYGESAMENRENTAGNQTNKSKRRIW